MKVIYNDLRIRFQVNYMSKQYEILMCPFCHKGEISCLYFPSTISVKRNVTASLPSKGSISKSKDTWIVQLVVGLVGRIKRKSKNN